MSESPEDKLARVRQMAIDNGQTWDLSPNDQAALKHVLQLVVLLADEIRRLTDEPADDVIESFGSVVECMQQHGEAVSE